MHEGERALACAIIHNAIMDFKNRKITNRKGETVRSLKNARANRVNAAYLFLTGQTKISKFWFACASMHPINYSFLDMTRFFRHKKFTLES